MPLGKRLGIGIDFDTVGVTGGEVYVAGAVIACAGLLGSAVYLVIDLICYGVILRIVYIVIICVVVTLALTDVFTLLFATGLLGIADTDTSYLL